MGTEQLADKFNEILSAKGLQAIELINHLQPEEINSFVQIQEYGYKLSLLGHIIYKGRNDLIEIALKKGADIFAADMERRYDWEVESKLISQLFRDALNNDEKFKTLQVLLNTADKLNLIDPSHPYLQKLMVKRFLIGLVKAVMKIS